MPVQVAGPRFAPGAPAGAIQAEDGTYLLAEDDSFIESESGVGGKISTYPLVSVPDPAADVLVGNAGSVTSRFLIEDVLLLARDLKTYMPRGPRMVGDIASWGVTAGAVSVANTISYFSIFVPEPCTLTEVGAACVTAQASSLVRLGLYTFNGLSGVTTLDGDLVADFGTVSGASTGDKTISVSQAVERGLYLIAAAGSNHTSVRWRRPVTALSPHGFFGESSTAGESTAFWRNTGTDYSGGLPSTVVVSVAESSGNIAAVWPWMVFT